MEPRQPLEAIDADANGVDTNEGDEVPGLVVEGLRVQVHPATGPGAIAASSADDSPISIVDGEPAEKQ
eukprot:CAMPEP_0117663584 /NCGR_PEP_ID=MMETSP0804-20121206/8702_1 /TAXON_ID=1074897 /ORGANISM="Tetraselmis astigmatica, Strain CCMP880" /LENGTH=67 /DNA_ID=CAMNT_0005470635 /DNA_START=280 /DNA_END=483 /DNA_ORIENTATION=-